MLVERMIRAAKLDPDLYYEVQRDRMGNKQAFTVMLIVMACMIGPALLRLGPLGLAQAFMCTIGGWVCWSAIATVVGANMGRRADFEEVLRAVGFAHSPGVLYLLALVPMLGPVPTLVAWIWTMVARVVALREVLRFDTGKAIQVVLATTAILFVIDLVIGLPFSGVGFLLASLGLQV
jgi:hypothetical protein